MVVENVAELDEFSMLGLFHVANEWFRGLLELMLVAAGAGAPMSLWRWLGKRCHLGGVCC
jgi:hypothetical protein